MESLMVVGARPPSLLGDSAHQGVHPPLALPFSPYGHHACTTAHHHCQPAGMSNTEGERGHQLQMNFGAVHYSTSTGPRATAAQSNAPTTVNTVDPSAQSEMPRNGSVDSAISMEVQQPTYSPKQIGLYTMYEKIGSGIYGPVRRAVHNITKTEVAIKIIKKCALDPFKNGIIRIYREIEVQKRLNHPFVLDILQVMETGTAIYLVTEYCKGGELFNMIARKTRLNEAEARRYFNQVLTAVQYCHDRGVVHRDIKAENLLIDEFGNVKLADFGFSTIFGDDLLKTYCGSPQYAAPEVFEGKPYYGPQLDIWSLGVLLHVFLTGRTPFEGKNFGEIQDKVLNSKVEYPWHVSHEAAMLMNIMLNRDGERRATLRQVMCNRWVQRDEIPRVVQNWISIHDYIADVIPANLTVECLHALGITENQQRVSENRFDNVDGMRRLLTMEYKSRRLRRIWADSDTVNAVVAAQVLQSQSRRCKQYSTVPRIDGDPIHKELALREITVAEDEQKRAVRRTFLPGPEEYPYKEFKEEERKEKEENAIRNQRQELEQRSTESSQETLKVDEPIRAGARSTEIPDFEEAQQPVAVKKDRMLDSVDSSEGYGGTGEMSSLSTESPSLTSMPPPDLKRMPSDVCSRMGALDISQKRRSVTGAAEQAPLSKRPSLPECLGQAGAGEERGTLKLSDPPKKKERKTFFEMMRLRKKKSRGPESGQSSSARGSFLPAPPLPEGGSFDDADDGKTDI